MCETVHIIGGGVVGLCSAWYLQKLGYNVTVIDRSNLSDGTSHGNAGMIVPSHFVPLAAPGVIAQGIKWMFDSKSPFYIRPRLDTALLQWLWRFYRSCNAEHVKRSMPVIYQFNEWSKNLYEEFSQEHGFDFCFEKRGLMMLYKTREQENEECELAEKAHELGVSVQICDTQRLKELEPDIKIDALGGIYFPGDAHLYPQRFLSALKDALIGGGCTIITNKEVVRLNANHNNISELVLDDNQVVKLDKLVIAGGSWSAKLLRSVGVKLLLQDGKGYSLNLVDQEIRPHIPTILSEARVAITPMGNDLRIGGTLELSNLSPRINRSRLSGIIESVPRYYPELHVEMPDLKEVWHGFRPCTPDGLPYIDKLDPYGNTYIAAGHGMMGMSLGPATGKMIAELISGSPMTMSNNLFVLR